VNVKIESGILFKQVEGHWVTIEGKRIKITPSMAREVVVRVPEEEPVSDVSSLVRAAAKLWPFGVRGVPLVVWHETTDELEEAWEKTGWRTLTGWAPRGWYDRWDHEVHFEPLGVEPDEGDVAAFDHVVVHENLHASQTGRALSASLPSVWNEGLVDIATYYALSKHYSPDDENWYYYHIIDYGAYADEIESLCGMAYVISDGNAKAAAQLLHGIVEGVMGPDSETVADEFVSEYLTARDEGAYSDVPVPSYFVTPDYLLDFGKDCSEVLDRAGEKPYEVVKQVVLEGSDLW